MEQHPRPLFTPRRTWRRVTRSLSENIWKPICLYPEEKELFLHSFLTLDTQYKMTFLGAELNIRQMHRKLNFAEWATKVAEGSHHWAAYTSNGPKTRLFSKLPRACKDFRSKMIATHNSLGADLWQDRDFSGYCGCFHTPSISPSPTVCPSCGLEKGRGERTLGMGYHPVPPCHGDGFR